MSCNRKKENKAILRMLTTGNFEFQQKFFLLVGPSGSGKTAYALRMIYERFGSTCPTSLGGGTGCIGRINRLDPVTKKMIVIHLYESVKFNDDITWDGVIVFHKNNSTTRTPPSIPRIDVWAKSDILSERLSDRCYISARTNHNCETPISELLM